MRRARFACVAALCLCACTDWSASNQSQKPPTRPTVAGAPHAEYFLNEPFRVGNDAKVARCRVVEAKQRLAESATVPYPGARIHPDVAAIDIGLHCESADGNLLSSRDALPVDTVVLLARGGEERAARPNPPDDARDHLLFEVPDVTQGFLPTPRRYDVNTGRPVLAHERSVSALRFQAPTWSATITLRERLQDAALDAWLDRLVAALTAHEALDLLADDEASKSALAELAATYDEVRKRFRPARLALSKVAGASANTLNVTLSLSRPRLRANTLEVARFELGLVRRSDGSLRARSFDNRAAARIALECAALEEKLKDELRETARAKQVDTCNALGIVLPATCHEVAPELLSHALDVGARCHALFHEASQSKTRVPEDFQLTMRRGRSVGGLDHSPRYVVVLFHQGQVVFHGKHWVNSKERSDGRTSLALLAGLYDHVLRLDWFERRGGHYDREDCSPSEDLGDVITVRAGDRERMVLQRDGCRGPFSEVELTDLRRHIELVSGISGWTEPQPSFVDDAEQWAVAE